jgi:hypothetical protein
MPKRHNDKGRSTTERFLALPHFMLQSSAWLSLSPVARCVFIELAARYKGSNNGYLALSVRDAAQRVGCSKDSAARALADLNAKGFIEVCARGHFDRKSPHASEYRLTLYSCDHTGQRASKAFMSWRSDHAKSVAGTVRGTTSLARGTVTARTKENYRPRSQEKDRDPSIHPSDGLTGGTHIIYQRSGA